MKYILKTYRISLLILFILFMLGCSAALYCLYEFIQPITYTIQPLGNIKQPGELKISFKNTTDSPLGIILIAPDGKEYTQSSRDIKFETEGSTRNISILTAKIGEWKVKYRNIIGIDESVSRTFNESNAAILIDTKATKDTNDESKYIVSMNFTNKNYQYNIKAVRRNDGFSLTSSGDGGTILTLESYPYTGVWDFYLSTIRGTESYNTMFSYTFS